MGYPKVTRGRLFYSPQDKKVFVSTNVTFLENDYVINFKPRSKVVLEELRGDMIAPQPTRVVEIREEEETSRPSQNITLPRRSGRIVRQPIRYGHEGETNVLVTDTDVDDPTPYNDTMKDIDKDKWLEAMNLEMESMYSNSVWEVVDPPENIRPIGCKWIFKKKERCRWESRDFQSYIKRPYTKGMG